MLWHLSDISQCSGGNDYEVIYNNVFVLPKIRNHKTNFVKLKVPSTYINKIRIL